MTKKFILIFIPFLCYTKNSFDLKLLNNEHVIPVAVIGGGCAGLSAAMVTEDDASISSTVFQKFNDGSALDVKTPVGNWPGIFFSFGNDIINDLTLQAERFNTGFVNENIAKVNFSTWPFVLTSENNTEYKAISVIIATGAQPRKLNAGEEKFLNKGIWYSMYYDSNNIDAAAKGGTAIVVGSGQDALSKARYISSKANKVYMLVRGDRLKVAPWKEKIFKQDSKIEILYKTTVDKVLGDKEFSGIEAKQNGKTIKLDANVMLIGIGYEPCSNQFTNGLDTKDGFIVLKSHSQQTNIEGVFAAGDITKADSADAIFYGQGAIAAGDGMKAGYDAIQFLQNIGVTENYLKNINTFKAAPKTRTTSFMGWVKSKANNAIKYLIKFFMS